MMSDDNRFAPNDNIDPDLQFFSDIHSNLEVDKQSQYFDLNNINQFLSSDNPNFLVMTYNIRSFHKNSDHFIAMLNLLDEHPDVIILTETWNTPANVSQCYLEGYDAHHVYRENARGGGVSIFCKNSFNSSKLNTISVCNNFVECCSIRVRVGTLDKVIAGIYRPPGNLYDVFLNYINYILEDSCIKNNNAILAGDFNVNLINFDSAISTDVLNLLQSYQFIPVITKPTRFPSDSSNIQPSLLDHIYVNSLEIYKSGIILYDQTDHCPVFYQISFQQLQKQKIKVSFRLHLPEFVDKFAQQISSISWEVQPGTISQKFLLFNELCNTAYRTCFPLKTKFISIKRIQKPWIDATIFQIIKTKSHYFKLHRLGIISKSENNKYKNMLSNKIRHARKLHYRNSFDKCRNDIKATWKLIKSNLSPSYCRRNINSIIVNDCEVVDEEVMADKVNSYFSSIALQLKQNIPNNTDFSPCQFINFNNINSFFLAPITIDSCKKIISQLKNSSFGRDTMPTSIIKACNDIIAEPLVGLINNQCISEGVFPNFLKQATVTPIFKKGNTQDMSNYRV